MTIICEEIISEIFLLEKFDSFWRISLKKDFLWTKTQESEGLQSGA